MVNKEQAENIIHNLEIRNEGFLLEIEFFKDIINWMNATIEEIEGLKEELRGELV